MLQEEALIISERLGKNSVGFTASNGWLKKWKKRYKLVLLFLKRRCNE